MKYRLCGGTFFALLVTAKKRSSTYGERYKGISNGMTEGALLWALARIVNPTLPKPAETQKKALKDGTLLFKKCKNWGGVVLQLDDNEARKTFGLRVKNNYKDVLAEMVELCEFFLVMDIKSNKTKNLVKALLDVIQNDDNIDEQQVFYCERGGRPINKQQLCKSKVIYFQSFILGIWHYVVSGVDNNTIGESTYEVWCPAAGGNVRDVISSLWEESNRNIDLKYISVEEKTEETDETDEPEIEVLSGDESEVVEESNETEPPNTDSKDRTIQVFFGNVSITGNNNSVNGYVERL